MNGYLAVTSRELRERRLVFLAALAIGVIAIVMPFVISREGSGPEESVLVIAVVAAVGFGLGTAILGGVSMLGRDLVERRVSFYLARPIPTATIWGGKMTAAVLLAVGAFAVTLLPVIVLRFRRVAAEARRWSLDDVNGLAFFLLVVLAAVGVGHLFGIALRARSAWVALDLAAPVAIALVVWMVIGWFAGGYAMRLIVGSVVAIAASFLIAVWIAGALGFVRGRSDIREVHKRTSIALWSIMGSFALLLAGYGLWVRNVDASDLTRVTWVAAPHNGDFAIFGGPAAGRADYDVNFYIDAESDRPLSLGPAAQFALADQAKSAAWLTSTAFRPGLQNLVIGDFSGERPRITTTRITIDGLVDDLALSPAARRVAAVQRGLLLVWDADTQKSIVSVKTPEIEGARIWGRWLQFQDEGALRLEQRAGRRGENIVHVSIFDLATRSWKPGPPVEASYRRVLRSPDRTTTLVRREDDAWTLLDADGTAVATIPGRWASFLPDSRIVAHVEGEIALYDRSGVRARAYRVPAGEIPPATVPRDGWLAFGVLGPGDAASFRIHLLNLETGEMREAAAGATGLSSPADRGAAPASFAARLHLDAKRALVHFDPLTGETRVLGGPRS